MFLFQKPETQVVEADFREQAPPKSVSFPSSVEDHQHLTRPVPDCDGNQTTHLLLLPQTTLGELARTLVVPDVVLGLLAVTLVVPDEVLGLLAVTLVVPDEVLGLLAVTLVVPDEVLGLLAVGLVVQDVVLAQRTSVRTGSPLASAPSEPSSAGPRYDSCH